MIFFEQFPQRRRPRHHLGLRRLFGSGASAGARRNPVPADARSCGGDRAVGSRVRRQAGSVAAGAARAAAPAADLRTSRRTGCTPGRRARFPHRDSCRSTAPRLRSTPRTPQRCPCVVPQVGQRRTTLISSSRSGDGTVVRLGKLLGIAAADVLLRDVQPVHLRKRSADPARDGGHAHERSEQLAREPPGQRDGRQHRRPRVGRGRSRSAPRRDRGRGPCASRAGRASRSTAQNAAKSS